MFNPNDCAGDTTLRNMDGSWPFRNSRFYTAYPGYDWGILGGWAWGASRVADYLVTDKSIDKKKLIVSGASRSGKALSPRYLLSIGTVFDSSPSFASARYTMNPATKLHTASGCTLSLNPSMPGMNVKMPTVNPTAHAP